MCGTCADSMQPTRLLLLLRKLCEKTIGVNETQFCDSLSQNFVETKSGTSAAKLTESTIIEFLRQLVAEIPWGHHLLILNKLDRSRRPPLLPPRHRPIRLVPQCPAQPDQGRRVRTGGDGKEDPQLPARPAGAPRGAGRRDAQELLQSGVPRHPPGGQGAGTRGPADLPPAAVHPRTRLRLLLRGPPAPADAWARRSTSSTCSSTTASSRRWSPSI